MSAIFMNTRREHIYKKRKKEINQDHADKNVAMGLAYVTKFELQ